MALQWSKIMLFPHFFDGHNAMPPNILLKREVPPCLVMILHAFLYMYIYMKSMNAKGLVVDTEVGLFQEIPGIVFGPQETPRIALLALQGGGTDLMTPGWE